MTDRELLKYAGRLSVACSMVVNSHVFELSENIDTMNRFRQEYDNAILERHKKDMARRSQNDERTERDCASVENDHANID